MNEDRLFRPEGDDYYTKRPDNRQKSGCGWKVLLIVLASMGALSFLCCIGIGFSFYSMVPKFHRNPEVAERVFREVVAMDLPASIEPTAAVTMGFFNFLKVKGVIFTGQEESETLAVVSLKGRMATSPEMRSMIEDAIQDRSGTDPFVVEESEERVILIERKPQKFLFLTGFIREQNESDPQTEGTDTATSESEAQDEQPATENVTEAPPETTTPGQPATEEPVAAPADSTQTAENSGNPAETADQGKKYRQVRGILPISQGVILFLYTCEQEQWNEEEVVRMIESIRLP